ncbi:ATP-binding cassette domain-containing protein [Arthrobacter sp. NIO-1057]|uniref:ATP-binding cassette domain-containing protein n=1 Tax=Arthrobacter sp. NIO-1057 TaxID=993071 RepID=UPI00071D1E41|nr:ATP-binding cassette domain-containing protein [Arthrobacter sp. NIO-1057]KSU68039.1 hypothetical protein AS038_02805 [Arthrobacter sp. NIO-1057]SCB86756.1 peptide/nickel transport system permease protein [Arthrobacter sp. NIO-1057]
MRRFRFSIIPGIICVVLLAYAWLAPLLGPVTADTVNLGSVYQSPNATHVFGTDQLGRDVWVRTAAALRVSLLMALGAAVFSTLLGVLAAVMAVTFGRVVDGIISRSIDGLNAIPHLLLSVVILALWPGQIWAIIISIAVTHWTQVARVLRAKLLAERESGYVKLSAATGASTVALWRTHLIPAVLPQIGIGFALQVPHAMWHESALSFLGVGLPAQSASLGLILEDARSGILAGTWWLLLFPSAVLVLACWAIAGLLRPSTARRPLYRSRRRNLRHDFCAVAESQEVFTAGFSARATVTADEEILVNDVQISAAPGTIVALTGVSGAGKTLFLRAIAGLLPGSLSASTHVMFNGRYCNNARQGKMLGKDLVFIPGSASTSLNPVRTIRQTLERAFRDHARVATGQQLERYWRNFNLEADLLDRYPHQLSGGQAQRALLALGLVGEPACILLDEPTSALDEDTRRAVSNMLRTTAEKGTIIVMVTHDLELAEQLATVIHTIHGGELVPTRSAHNG